MSIGPHVEEELQKWELEYDQSWSQAKRRLDIKRAAEQHGGHHEDGSGGGVWMNCGRSQMKTGMLFQLYQVRVMQLIG